MTPISKEALSQVESFSSEKFELWLTIGLKSWQDLGPNSRGFEPANHFMGQYDYPNSGLQYIFQRLSEPSQYRFIFGLRSALEHSSELDVETIRALLSLVRATSAQAVLPALLELARRSKFLDDNVDNFSLFVSVTESIFVENSKNSMRLLLKLLHSDYCRPTHLITLAPLLIRADFKKAPTHLRGKLEYLDTAETQKYSKRLLKDYVNGLTLHEVSLFISKYADIKWEWVFEELFFADSPFRVFRKPVSTIRELDDPRYSGYYLIRNTDTIDVSDTSNPIRLPHKEVEYEFFYGILRRAAQETWFAIRSQRTQPVTRQLKELLDNRLNFGDSKVGEPLMKPAVLGAF